ncbi:MAG: bifunctional precorrin-2 dehydrogenase/sirohydrochlorin ferrochelatase [Clostridiales Family XIII bacterium]|jgi:siroheme synthase-like protein|nr:bifunctional precorrin-2 dehydrogenase/sirohydrochlorin ferrochelatase [Clostridiales Family XIII bacterium]
MPYFPLFINIEGRRCLVIGGGAVAARKAGALLEYGARVRIIAPDLSQETARLAQREGVEVVRRVYGGIEDLRGAALVISATHDVVVNTAVAHDSNELSIPVNVADVPALCTFYFPALVRRGELSVGFSTSGSCPRLAARFREWLDAQLPADSDAALAGLKSERERLMRAGASEDKIMRILDAEIDKLLVFSNGA